MKKSYIPVLIILISFSLIGLVAIQIYWIQNSVALRDTQFRRNVQNALAEVNNALEREEAHERMRRSDIGKKIRAQIDSISDEKTLDHLWVSDNTTRDSIAYLSNDGNNLLRLNSTKKELSLPNPMVVVHERKHEKPEKEVPNYFPEREQKIITELLTGLVNIDRNSDFLNIYDDAKMDSLLNVHLSEFGGIDASYQFGIFDLFDNPLLVSLGLDDTTPLYDSGFKVRLFPDDFTQPTRYLRIWFPNQESYLIRTLWPLLASSTIFLIAIVLAFAYSIRTIFRQKKVSEIKNDFINNMTHELKTPISTISLACEALADPVMSKSKERHNQYVGMIRDENKRLGVLVENVLRSAVLDRQDMELAYEEIDLNEVIETAIKNIELQIHKKGGSIEFRKSVGLNPIQGDRIHLTNVVYNLLDNAIKYSSDDPKVKVSTSKNDSTVLMSVSDNGIGIKKDQQDKIFDKLYRVPTGDVHDIKGFGLGLSYVRAIIEKHLGIVSVKSELGKGSTFTIQIPHTHDI
ncbi:MAG: HAMP domain-containing sensor histidine kinase [Bacteroidota bacterium]